MTGVRLMNIRVTTPHTMTGGLARVINELGLQKKFKLDAPPQIVVSRASSDVDVETTTILVFQYSKDFASVTAYNEGIADAEGEIITVVKAELDLEEIYFATEVLDFKPA